MSGRWAGRAAEHRLQKTKKSKTKKLVRSPFCRSSLMHQKKKQTINPGRKCTIDWTLGCRLPRFSSLLSFFWCIRLDLQKGPLRIGGIVLIPWGRLFTWQCELHSARIRSVVSRLPLPAARRAYRLERLAFWWRCANLRTRI